MIGDLEAELKDDCHKSINGVKNVIEESKEMY